MKGLYIGSFDMFTNGHLDIVEQAVDLFDELWIVIGENPMKKRRFTIRSSMQFIDDCTKNKPYKDKIIINTTSQIASKYAKIVGCSHIIRGLRDFTDYTNEERIAKIYKAVNPDINIIYFRTNFDEISSSMVKLLMDNGENIDPYISGNINLLKETKWEAVLD